MWKNYGGAWHSTDDNRIRRMRPARWIIVATDAFRMFNTYLLFHGNVGYANAQLWYVIRTMRLCSFRFRLIQFPFIIGTHIWHWFASNIHGIRSFPANKYCRLSHFLDGYVSLHIICHVSRKIYIYWRLHCTVNKTAYIELNSLWWGVQLKKSHFHEIHITELIWWFQADAGSCGFGVDTGYRTGRWRGEG